jgi:chromosome segregation ATPase
MKNKLIQKVCKKYSNLDYRDVILALSSRGKVNVTEELIDFQVQEISEKNKKIVEQNSAIELLLDKTAEFENGSVRLKKKLQKAEQKISDSENKIIQLETYLSSTKSKLKNCIKENNINQKEIQSDSARVQSRTFSVRFQRF